MQRDGQQMSEEGPKRNGARGCDKVIAYVRPLNLEHRCTFACMSIMLYERFNVVIDATSASSVSGKVVFNGNVDGNG